MTCFKINTVMNASARKVMSKISTVPVYPCVMKINVKPEILIVQKILLAPIYAKITNVFVTKDTH